MAFTNLPPQAYTRDVLAAAYEWLRSQPASIRELATNSDNLVSLYMQSRRRPNSLNQLLPNHADGKEVMSSAGAEAFKNDLKNLAEGLKQFEDQRTDAAAAIEAPPTMAPSAQASYQVMAPSPQTMPAAPLNLDQRSLETVRKVQSLFNLSSEREALRFLITVGFEKVKDFIARP